MSKLRPIRRRAAIATGLAVACVAAVVAPAWAAVSPQPDRTWGVNGRVYAIHQAGDRVYVGGKFTAAVAPNGTTVARTNVAAFDVATGALDTGFNPNPSGEVQDIASSPDGSTIYLGGGFSKVGGISRRNLAAVNATTGATLTGWRADTAGKVFALAVGNGRLYVGGAMTAVAGNANSQLAAVDLADGHDITAFDASATGEDPVRDMVLSPDGQRLYFVGDFLFVNGQDRAHIAAVSASDGSLVTGFAHRGPIAFGMTIDNDRLYVAFGGGGGDVRAIDPLTGRRLWSKHGNGNMQAVALFGGLLYVAGHFNGPASFDGLTRYKFAAMDPATGAVDPVAPRVNSALGGFEVYRGTDYLYYGGDFTNIAGVDQPHFARMH